MLYRVCVAAIVGFWLWMAGLLARTVWLRDDVPSTPVPVAYVERLVFRHETPSDLVLYRQHRRADGNFHLQPKRIATGDLLSTNGNFQLGLPGLSDARVLFHGALELDAHEQVERVDLSVSLHEPKNSAPGVTLHLDGQAAQNRWHYQLTQAGTLLREGSGTPEELLAAFDPHLPGLDPRVVTQAVAAPRAGAVAITAQRGKLHIGEDDIDTYVVTIRQGEGLETTVHVNQVGQILAVKTFLGFDLYDETLSP